MAISLAHPLPGAAASGGFRWRPAFTENGVHVPAMLHNGQDYAADTGTPIRAAHSGKVLWSGWDPVGGGWGVQLGHDDGWSTLYFHMSHRSTDVSIGQRVTTGQTIGRVGMSGLATGPHLHFMLRIKGSDVDPVPYINSAVQKPSTARPASAGEIEEDMLWIADVNGTWYLVVPTGAGKPNATTLPGNSGMGGGGAAKAGIPVIRLKDTAALRRVANA